MYNRESAKTQKCTHLSTSTRVGPVGLLVEPDVVEPIGRL